jgi:Zn-dependent alcohol dehydrogenase
MESHIIKAAVSYEVGKPLVVERIKIDSPQAGEVKVKLAACAICHSDLFYLGGEWGQQPPTVYGHEAAGVVAEAGPEVVAVKPGDPVIVTLVRHCGRCYFCSRGEPTMCEGRFAPDRETCLHTLSGQPLAQGLRVGGFAEFVVVDQSQVVPLSTGMPFEQASLLACGVLTGLGAVTNTARVPFGSSVVVIGAGGVGLNSVQGAALSGAQPIIAIDLADSKLEAARQFGATHAINPAADAQTEVQALTGGRGADFVFVTAGSGKAIDLGLALMRKGGTLVVVGMPPSGVVTQLELGYLASYGQSILGSKMGSARPEVDLPKLMRLYEQGRLKLEELITARYTLEQINEAIASVKRGEALRNVVVF